LATAVSAQDDEVDYARLAERVDSVAFDPRGYFGGEIRPEVTIAYRTNVTWPVYSIAIARGCLERTVEEKPQEECLARWTARMVRAPVDPAVDEDDERIRGRHLLDQLVERRMTNREDMLDRLNSLELEWVQADLNACPAAQPVLERLAMSNWVPEGSVEALTEDRIRIYIHPPTVELVLNGYGGTATFRGAPDGGTPESWAEELYNALEPCWGRNYARRPWERR
jgi:hypothetical protein